MEELLPELPNEIQKYIRLFMFKNKIKEKINEIRTLLDFKFILTMDHLQIFNKHVYDLTNGIKQILFVFNNILLKIDDIKNDKFSNILRLKIVGTKKCLLLVLGMGNLSCALKINIIFIDNNNYYIKKEIKNNDIIGEIEQVLNRIMGI